MKGIKNPLILFVFFALLLSLASCAQGKVNENRLPDGGTQSPSDISTQGPSSGWVQPSDDPDPNDPLGFDNSVDVENNTFEDARRGEGEGTVFFTVTSTGFYDSLADAGISEESYAVSGKEKYDHYVKIDMTVKNVDVPYRKQYNVNAFRLMGHVFFWYLSPVWFSLGGKADDEQGPIFISISRPPVKPWRYP